MSTRHRLRYQYPLPTLLPDPSKVGDMRRGRRMNDLYLPLESHFQSQPEVLIGGNGFLCLTPEDSDGWVKLDLVVAFNVIPDAIIGRNGYIIDGVGKPPEFVLEVVPEILNDPWLMSAEDVFGEFRPVDVKLDYDYNRKRAAYARYGVAEYWRLCDPVDQHQDTPLAGWKLADDDYQLTEITVTDEGELRGYSPALDLELCWDGDSLRWRQATGSRILPNLPEQTERLDAALKLWTDTRRRCVDAEDRAKRLEDLLRQASMDPNIEPSIDDQIEWWRELERLRRPNEG